MLRSVAHTVPLANQILAGLPKKEYQRLHPDLEEFPLAFGKILFESGEVLRHVYFPNQGIVSLLTLVEKRSTLEVGIVGNEGMVGIQVFLGAKASINRALVQGAGTAMRMKTEALHKHIKLGGLLPGLLLRYTNSLLSQISQSAACNRFHKVEARLARWLMMTHDRLASDRFRMTQKFLSDMLGVRREGVTAAARALQQKNLIRYVRGLITIIDLDGLATASCQCYEIVKRATV